MNTNDPVGLSSGTGRTFTFPRIHHSESHPTSFPSQKQIIHLIKVAIHLIPQECSSVSMVGEGIVNSALLALLLLYKAGTRPSPAPPTSLGAAVGGSRSGQALHSFTGWAVLRPCRPYRSGYGKLLKVHDIRLFVPFLRAGRSDACGTGET